MRRKSYNCADDIGWSIVPSGKCMHYFHGDGGSACRRKILVGKPYGSVSVDNFCKVCHEIIKGAGFDAGKTIFRIIDDDDERIFKTAEYVAERAGLTYATTQRYLRELCEERKLQREKVLMSSAQGIAKTRSGGRSVYIYRVIKSAPKGITRDNTAGQTKADRGTAG